MTDDQGELPELIAMADQALVRTVDGLSDSQYAEPSQLPGWTRAHVVAHVTLNAEALAGVLHGAHVGSPQPMYASQEARDADIAALAGASTADLRERFLAATGTFTEALGAMHEGDWKGRFERTPGAPGIRLANVPLMRLREVEIHHADLDAGYTAADWSPRFCRVLLDSLTKFDTEQPFEVRPTDLDGTWRYGDGDGGPVVSGTAGALGWWLTGRGAGEGLASDSGVLPRMEAW
ncbi:maleylpyruvate isomerase [Nocardioides cavernae]|uniref:Maleylpyruvate isomerase n=1 Tax=Nocardioides cavernae TaxID=1921566 RepID=A0A7Y9H5K2_9ACTN|nr:maleylpyruvate isomerase family mycothiol-dependent enzyme [Nocardioides cavernae]NYE38330.1 maleylpyruvate isomerase [Nocardioides cavernae]